MRFCGTGFFVRMMLIGLCIQAFAASWSSFEVDAVAQPAEPNKHEIIKVLITDKGFAPSRLQTKLGQPVRLDIRNLSSTTHTFVLPDYNVYSCILMRGDAVTFELVPNKPGDFEFFSDMSRTELEPCGKLSVR